MWLTRQLDEHDLRRLPFGREVPVPGRFTSPDKHQLPAVVPVYVYLAPRPVLPESRNGASASGRDGIATVSHGD